LSLPLLFLRQELYSECCDTHTPTTN
jgi:hypothetical protein